MARKILSLMALHGIENPEMAAALQMSLSTFYRRLKAPDTFTCGELKKVARKLKTTISALAEGVK